MKRILIAALLAAAGIAPVYAQSAPHKVTDEGVKPPVLVRDVKPNYTDDAMRRRVEGSVELDVVVKSDGKIGEVAVTKALDPDLDEEAVKAVRQWRFRPGTKDSKPVDVQVQIEMTFALKR